jgi:hypothetical protein
MEKKRIGCLHAHYSNIEYIEQELSAYDVELLHFVDPALVYRISTDDNFSKELARDKVKQQVEWIIGSKVDAILMTCTNYIALLPDEPLTASVPIIKIDEPFFNYLCLQEKPQILLFTNPATVEGTMKRFAGFAQTLGKSPQIEAQVIDNAFELIMKGKKENYLQELTKYIRNLLELESNDNKAISVAQLSMVEAARKISNETNITIGNPLEPLAAYIRDRFLLTLY